MQITVTQGGNTATFPVTGAKLARMSVAWQKQFDLSAPPTVDDIAAHFKAELRRIVHNGELKAASEVATPLPFDPD